ncbi:MAG: SDR family oxidoreductase [Nitrosotalea sp.]
MKKRILILGIGGLTGSKIVELARSTFEIYGTYNLRNPEFNFVRSFRLDITNNNAMKELISNIYPDIIINTCALNSVDYCENHEDEAKKVNINSVEGLSEMSDSVGSKLIHLSSDSVFDGTKITPYTEEDIPKPINVYGYTKMVGEKIVLQNSNNVVVRASVLYGWLHKSISQRPSSSMKPTNFAQWLITKLQSKETIKIVTDENSSPIIADDFARSIIHLADGNYHGLFHSAPPIQINRYDFSVRLAKALELDWNLIQPTTNKELGRNVTTGFNKCLDSSKIIKEANFHFISLEESFDLLKRQISI